MILASLLSSSKYIIVNKDLIKILGLNESVILGELCSEYTYWENTNQLMDDGYFYSTRENIENNTGINAHYQRIAMKNLEQKGIISIKKRGIPCKIYYKINEETVVEYLKIAKLPVVHEMNDKENISCNTSDSSGSQQEVNEVNGNNNNINNKINNNKEHTHAPTPDEEKKEYATKVTMTKKEYQSLTDTYGEDEECTKLLKEVQSNKEEGTIVFEGLRFRTYYIKDSKQPNGYQLSDEVLKLEINDKGVFIDNTEIEEKDKYTTKQINDLIKILRQNTNILVTLFNAKTKICNILFISNKEDYLLKQYIREFLNLEVAL